MEKDENNDRKRRNKRKRCVEFTTHASFSILHFHIAGYPSGSISPARALYYPVAQIDVGGWLKRPYLEVWPDGLTHLAASEWLSRSWFFRIEWTSWLSSTPLHHGLQWAKKSHVIRKLPVVGLDSGFYQIPLNAYHCQSTRWRTPVFTFVLVL